MSKQITPAELAVIVTNLLTRPDSVGELCEEQAFLSFVTDIAEVVCNHCGGEVSSPANFLDDACYVAIIGNDSLPEGGGIWADYDKEGALYPDVLPATVVEVDVVELAARQLIPTDQQLLAVFGEKTEIRNPAVVGLGHGIDSVVELAVRNLAQLTKLEMHSLAPRDVVHENFWPHAKFTPSGDLVGLLDALRSIAVMEVREHLYHTVTQVSADSNLWRFSVTGALDNAENFLHIIVDAAGGAECIMHPLATDEERRTLFLRDFLSL